MTGHPRITEADLHAYIDGELPQGRAEIVQTALATDPVLAARAAGFIADKAALAAAFQPIAQQAVPAAWVARIEQAASDPIRTRRGIALPRHRRIRPYALVFALAACLVMAIGAGALLRFSAPATDPILAQAEAARQARLAPIMQIVGAGLADTAMRDVRLTDAVGLKLHAPDLDKLGWRLTELDTYTASAALRYRAADGRALTLFVRRSNGTPRFDLLKNGALRTCIWQDEVVGAVMMGEMSAGQMMRVASAAYVALNL